MFVQKSLGLWIKGARPRTLPAAIAPVVVGTACAFAQHAEQNSWINSLLALVVSLALQVAVNYANDYSDGIRGTDAKRVGPLRLVGSGAKDAGTVKLAAFLAFGVAALGGLILAATTSWWILLVGVFCFFAGWFYTGGKHPYGYLGFGEIFVFIFFGVVATTGTTFVVVQKVTILSVLSSVVVGSLACALLAVNNIRDIDGDTLAGKKTLAVRIGENRARKFFIALFIFAGFAICVLSFSEPTTLFGLLGLATAIVPVNLVRRGAKGVELIAVLTKTGQVQIFTALSLTVGLLLV